MGRGRRGELGPDHAGGGGHVGSRPFGGGGWGIGDAGKMAFCFESKSSKTSFSWQLQDLGFIIFEIVMIGMISIRPHSNLYGLTYESFTF